MNNFERDRVRAEELPLIAPCGIFCGACDSLLGRSKGLAKELYR